MTTIYLKNGAKEQLNDCSINPWHQAIPYREEKEKGFEEELTLHDSELEILSQEELEDFEVEELQPISFEDKVPEIMRRIIVHH